MSVAGLIDEIKRRGARVSLSLDDRSGRIEVTLFDEVFQRHRDLIVKDALVLVEGSVRFDEFTDGWRLAARRIADLDQALEGQARRIVLKWPAQQQSGSFERLEQILTRFRPGPCPVTIEYRAAEAQAALTRILRRGREGFCQGFFGGGLDVEVVAGEEGLFFESLADAGPRP